MKSNSMQPVRRISCALASALVLALALPTSAAAQAQPPAQQQSQVPGYYRMMLGDFEVTALYDGWIGLEPALFKGSTAEDIQGLLARMFQESTGGIQTAVNGYLVHTGSQLILVDTGAAQCFGPTLGGIQDNIRAAGYTPEQIDTVLLTHLHPDHSCGLLSKDGKAAFPNAEVRVSKAEADFWLSREVAAKMPEDSQAFFKMARESVAPYQATGKLQTYTIGDALIPGVEVVSSPGHTPGHASYLVTSGDQSLLIWGDIVHNYAVQFPRPEVSIEFDTDAPQAIATRKKLLADAALDKLWVAGAHLPFPGLGHVRAETQGYSWVPVEYGPVNK